MSRMCRHLHLCLYMSCPSSYAYCSQEAKLVEHLPRDVHSQTSMICWNLVEMVRSSTKQLQKKHRKTFVQSDLVVLTQLVVTDTHQAQQPPAGHCSGGRASTSIQLVQRLISAVWSTALGP
jgi:hypothetical protein